jgi:glycosyltransferase involved in cell wall biosynthesis
MGPQDGVDYWLRAVREMVITLGCTDLLAVIIGSGDAAPDLHALAKELGIDANVWFTGRISDVAARTYLSTVAVCVQPDPLSPLNDKSTMNKVMEYMALGKPLVAFDLAETRYSAGEAALYAEPNDELDFARKVCWLLDHPDECARRGALGADRVAAALEWEHSVPALLQAYSQGLSLLPHGSPVAATVALNPGNER